MKRLKLILAVLLGLSFLPVEAGLFGKKDKEETEEPEPLPPLKGPKKLLAVQDFENKVEHPAQVWWKGIKLGTGMSDMLVTALMETDYFIVLERESLEDGVFAEQDLAASGRMAKSKTAQMGKTLSSQILVKGAVTVFDEGTKASGGGGKLRVGGVSLGLGGGGGEATVGVDIRIFDTTTGQVLAAKTCKGFAKKKRRGLSIGLSGTHHGRPASIGFGGEKMEKSPLGDATRDAIEQCVRFIIEELNQIPWKGKVIKASPDGEVYINCGARNNTQVGDLFNVYQAGEPLIDPDTGENLGSEETYLGKIKVSSVKQKFSICTTVEGSGFEKENIIRAPKA
jgi:curli biogenesis system outer membrane secretion channel CsgG